ncbi:arginase family protein [Lacisediminihabitans profunda]|uniref:Formimidoylglutamase n=1 Tax=Lacisediminihabitans profunda TaxID=2594790 RepID=A0A5C8UJZ1_9MICO|nr:arginase family protein [Lacisediminihabitans profunda]TXN28105.1 formimidoylglutamase [Lacisediminihabitans profunda]
MTLSRDALWARSGDWPAATGPEVAGGAIDLGLIGIPTWRTSLSSTGAAATPSAVRAALRYYSEFLSPDRGVRSGARLTTTFADWGDIEDPDADEAGAISAMATAAARTRLLVALGGDNAATVPAALGTWGDRIGSAGLVTLDAHHDLRDGVSNGSPVRRLVEAGLAGRRVVQVGIADFANSAEYSARAADYGITVIHRDELHRRPMAEVMAEALEIAASAGGPVHVDVDVDVCDRAVAPACPASVPGGIAAWELRVAVRAAGGHPSVESIDFAEVDSTADSADGRTVRLVALCVLEAAAGLEARR